MVKNSFLILICGSLLAGCGSGGGDVGNTSTVSEASPGTLAAALPGGTPAEVILPQQGVLTVLDDSTFNSLPAQKRYQTANKLLATLYDGIAVDDFFTLEAGLGDLQTKVDNSWLSQLRESLNVELPPSMLSQLDLEILGSEEFSGSSEVMLEGAFNFSRDKPRELPLARLYTYPHSRNRFSQWMAWHLANSILFSPATELDSTEMTDAQNIFRRLDNSIMSGKSIRDIVYEHMGSQENWRRFRSPEDNTREMLEIFLGFEDLDAEVPAASEACRDLYLTEENEGYLLAYTDFPNTEVQTVLGQPVVSCDDFYRVVANHENLIPVIAGNLVRYFFADTDREQQAAIVNELVQLQPQSFEQLFMPILFSSTYLLNTERLKSFEEIWMNTAKRLHWEPRSDTFRGMASGRGGYARAYMAEMGWPAMSAKLGRVSGIPTDSLSFANFHKALRENLLIDNYRWRDGLGISEPDPPVPVPLQAPSPDASQQAVDDYNTTLALNEQMLLAMTPEERAEYDIALARFERNQALYEQVETLNLAEFIDYLFLSVSSRKATDMERNELIALFAKEDYLRIEVEGQYLHKWSRSSAASLVTDYLSRLPELYYLQQAPIELTQQAENKQ